MGDVGPCCWVVVSSWLGCGRSSGSSSSSSLSSVASGTALREVVGVVLSMKVDGGLPRLAADPV